MKSKFIFIISNLMLYPTILYAQNNEGLVLFSLFDIIFLSFVTGWVESAVLKKYNLPNKTWLIILSNYISSIIGYSFVVPYFSKLGGNDDFWALDDQINLGLYKMSGFAITLAAFYVSTLLIEYPMAFFAIKDRTLKGKLPVPFLIIKSILFFALFLVYYIWIRF